MIKRIHLILERYDCSHGMYNLYLCNQAVRPSSTALYTNKVKVFLDYKGVKCKRCMRYVKKKELDILCQGGKIKMKKINLILGIVTIFVAGMVFAGILAQVTGVC